MRVFKLKMKNWFLTFLFSPVIIIYKVLTDFFLKCEIPASTEIGGGLVIHHVTGIVINKNAKLGRNVTLAHNVTIGNKIDLNGRDLGSPIIGDNVTIHANSILFGPITIGENSIIGAGSVVFRDVEPNSIIAGNPAKLIRRRA